MDSKQSQANRPKSLCQKIGEEADDIIASQENLNVDLHRRRHAINITNNPGYRVSEADVAVVGALKALAVPGSYDVVTAEA
jgi:hypothetical protein